MDKENAIILCKEQEIRRTWHEGELSKGWGQIVTPLYIQPVTNCHGLKLQASDSKKHKTDCANTKGVPSPQAGRAA